MKRGLFIDEHMNNYTNFLPDLVNVDVKIDEENKAAILRILFLMKSMRSLL